MQMAVTFTCSAYQSQAGDSDPLPPKCNSSKEVEVVPELQRLRLWGTVHRKTLSRQSLIRTVGNLRMLPSDFGHGSGFAQPSEDCGGLNSGQGTLRSAGRSPGAVEREDLALLIGKYCTLDAELFNQPRFGQSKLHAVSRTGSDGSLR